MLFNIEEFKAGRYAVHCETFDEIKDFLKTLDDNNILWCSGRSLPERRIHTMYAGKTYFIHWTEDLGLSFGNIETIMDNDIELIRFSELIFEKEIAIDDEDIFELLNGE